MDTAAIYHRPESEYAFLYTNTRFRIRLRTRKNDIKKVYVLCGDPYTITTEKWYQKQRPMKKCLSTNVHDYWEIEVTSETSRLQYAFHVVGEDNTDCFYGDQGIFPYRENVITEPNFLFSNTLFSSNRSIHYSRMGKRNSMVSNFSRKICKRGQSK